MMQGKHIWTVKEQECGCCYPTPESMCGCECHEREAEQLGQTESGVPTGASHVPPNKPLGIAARDIAKGEEIEYFANQNTKDIIAEEESIKDYLDNQIYKACGVEDHKEELQDLEKRVGTRLLGTLDATMLMMRDMDMLHQTHVQEIVVRVANMMKEHNENKKKP